MTLCESVSVWLRPYPSSHAFQLPECVGWPLEPYCPITPVLDVHDAVPDSKPGLAIFCPDEHVLAAVTVSRNVAVCDPVAAVPVTVIVYVPAPVVPDVPIVKVDDDPDATDVGENDAVVPDGNPLAPNDTVPADPEVTVVDTVELVPLPATTLAEVGLSAIEKSFAVALWTVSVNVVVCDPVAAVPVIVIAYVPTGVTLEVPIVNVDDDPELTDVGENDVVAPDGNPLALSDTDSALPEVTAVETVAVAPPPGATDAEVGLTAIEKSLLVVPAGPNAATPFGVPSPVGPS